MSSENAHAACHSYRLGDVPDRVRPDLHHIDIRPGTSASLYNPSSVALDKTGNVFFADPEEHVVLRLDATTGILTLAAGNGTEGFSGDKGPAASAQLGFGLQIAVDSVGNLYVADPSNNRIREVSNGVITTVAGNGTAGFGGDNGPATSAQLNGPAGLFVDAAGNLYIADSGNNRIREVSNGVITTVAGNGTAAFGGDNGPATSAQLNGPAGLFVDAAGNLYIADRANNRIRKVANGVITTVAGNGTEGFGSSGDNGAATSADLNQPQGVAEDTSGNLYIGDTGNDRIRKVTNGMITTVAGNGKAGFSGDNGPATSAELAGASGVAVDSAGNLYIADTGNRRVRKVANGVITTVAGNGLIGDGGPAIGAQLNSPEGVAVDAVGNLYIADFENSLIRKVTNGVITTVAGSATRGFGGDNGPATSAQLDYPDGVAVDSAGNLYFVDSGNNRVRKISGGVITTVAGNGTQGFSGDNGPAINAELNLYNFQPSAVAVDSAGNLYIADAGNDRVRKVTNGTITTVAGNGTQGFSGDNGPATSAQLNQPKGVAVDATGNLYIADEANQRIRKVASGVINTVAGNGTAGFSGDNGPAVSAKLSGPTGGVVDASGNLYFADLGNGRIRKIANGVITTVAGNGTHGFSGDNGPATSAGLNEPIGPAIDAAGNLYVDDWRTIASVS